MPLIQVNDTDLPDAATLEAALAGLAPRAPVVVMIHGYRYSPTQPSHDPHRLILADRPSGKRRGGPPSWPRHLGLTGRRGLAIAWGWEARGTIWSAWARAAASGARLARLVARLRAIAPDRPVHVIAHSLGARVALAALPGLPACAIDRIILIAAALFRDEAARLLDTPAGHSATIVHVTGRENRLFDLLLAACLPWQGRVVTAGLAAPNWLDLPLHRPGIRHALATLGHPVGPSRLPVCHWSGYLRPGIWRVYRSLVLGPDRLSLARLRDLASQPPCGAALRPEPCALPLQFPDHAPSCGATG